MPSLRDFLLASLIVFALIIAGVLIAVFGMVSAESDNHHWWLSAKAINVAIFSIFVFALVQRSMKRTPRSDQVNLHAFTCPCARRRLDSL